MSEESKLVNKYEKATKFTPEEIEKIKDVQKKYIGIQQAFGSLELTKLRLQQQLDASHHADDELRKKFIEIQQSEQDLIKELNKKYGEGTLNPETGEFTPTLDKSNK
tara:strand:+ start:235 stop:555 length:321 start_codon:yes stop_codon:yes gene_type:complete